MLPLEKTGLLQAFLGSLPQEIAMRLARAVELDRLMDGKGLPHEAILTGLRPILRQAGQPVRTMTPLRLFCRPFEDLLTSATSRVKQKASLSRANVAPIWLWLSRTLAADETQAFVAETKALILTQKMDEAMARAALFWTLAGNKIREALASDAGRKAARAALNGDIAVADAEEIALLLLAGIDVLKIQSVLVKPLARLSEDLLWQLRAIYDDLITRNPDAAPYVAVIAMNRLSRPWEALKLPLQICRQTQDTLISQTDMGLVGEILLGRMDNLKAAILSTRHPIPDVEKLLAEVASFAEMSSAIVKEIEVRRDGEWGQRLLKDRTAVGNVMDGFLDRAPKELAQALPLQKSTGPKLADFSRPIDPEKQAVALRYVKLATGCRNFAAASSCAAKQKTSTEDMGNYLRRHNEDLVKELRGADPAKRTAAESQFEFCVELTALLFSEEEAELLRRRGRAAQSAAA
jgi:hypothetical protein